MDENYFNRDPSFHPQDTNLFQIRTDMPDLQLKDIPIKQKDHVVIDSLQDQCIDGGSPLFSALCGLLMGKKEKISNIKMKK